MSNQPTPEFLKGRYDAGWKLVALEWERETDAAFGEPQEYPEEVPFGLKISNDGAHLEENSSEWEVLLNMTELIVRDQSLTEMAEELNRRGLRTRTGALWSPIDVFNMLPRLIEVGPRMFTSQKWIERRRSLFTAV